MTAPAPIDSENTPYDEDNGSSGTDESDIESSTTEEQSSDSKRKIKPFRKPIIFNEAKVDLIAKNAIPSVIEASSKILEIGLYFQLPEHVINVAVIYYYRFQILLPENTYNLAHKAAACNFLASKSEDSVRRLDAVCQGYMKWSSNGDASKVDLRRISELIKIIEMKILSGEGFHVNMSHPHRYVIKYHEVLKMSKKLLTAAYFIVTGMIHFTMLTLKYPMSYIAAAAIETASKWCEQAPSSLDGSTLSCPWYKTIEANKDLDVDTLTKMCNEFNSIWTKTQARYKYRLLEMRKKRQDVQAIFARNSSDASDGKGKQLDKRKDAKWPQGSYSDRKESMPVNHSEDSSDMWKKNRGSSNPWIPSKSDSSRAPTSSSAHHWSRHRPSDRSSKPSTHDGRSHSDRYSGGHGGRPHASYSVPAEDRPPMHHSHDRYGADRRKTHISPSKHCGPDAMPYSGHMDGGPPMSGMKRSFEASVSDRGQQPSPVKQRKP